jgi:PEGA domain.
MQSVLAIPILLSLSVPMLAGGPYTGKYSGSAHNVTENESASIEFTVIQNGSKLNGCAVISEPLAGSGPFEGGTKGEEIQLRIPGALGDVNATGSIVNGTLSGTYQLKSPWGTTEQGNFVAYKTAASVSEQAFDPSKCPVYEKLEKVPLGDSYHWALTDHGYVTYLNTDFSPAPVTPAGPISEKFSGHGITFLYPDQWSVKDRDKQIVVGDNDTSRSTLVRGVRVGHISTSKALTLPDALQNAVELMQKDDPAFITSTEPFAAQLGHQAAFVAQHRTYDSSHNQFRGFIAVIQDSRGYWLIQAQVPRREYSNHNFTFISILGSIAFDDKAAIPVGWDVAKTENIGRLTVRTMPPSTQVYVDGEWRGTTDDANGELTVSNLKLGNHHLRFTNTGFKEKTLDTAVQAGESNLDVALETADSAPLGIDEVDDLLHKVSKQRVLFLVHKYGVDFTLDEQRMGRLKAAGADDSVLLAIATSKK